MSYAAGSKVRASEVSMLGSGYLYGETVVYTADDTFSKGSFPGLRAVMVTAVGAGGGGGGAASAGANNASVAGGGGGGGTGVSFVLAASLAASETVTVGVGGPGGTAGNNAGTVGEDSLFGTHATGVGGGGGGGSAAASTQGIAAAGGSGGSGIGNITVIVGSDGLTGIRSANGTAAFPSQQGYGGASSMAGGKRAGVSAGGANGSTGSARGGGGSGGYDVASSTARSGGTGGDGRVVVEIYY